MQHLRGERRKMYYITPKTILDTRLESIKHPNWDIAVLIHHGAGKSEYITNMLNGKLYNHHQLLSMVGSDDVYEANFDNKKIAILKHSEAGPRTSILVEELAYLGVKYIVGCGSAASFSPDIKQGQAIVPDNAAITDGTSKAYSSDKYAQCDSDLLQLLIDGCNKQDIDIRKVTCATVDALYRESQELVDSFKDMKCDVLNMETSPLYTVAKACNVPAIWIGHVSDRLLKDGWEDWYVNKRTLLENDVKILKILLNALTKCL